MDERPIPDSDDSMPAIEPLGKARIDWGEISRRKDELRRRWDMRPSASGHPGSKPKVAHTELAAARKRQRQARKAGRR